MAHPVPPFRFLGRECFFSVQDLGSARALYRRVRAQGWRIASFFGCFDDSAVTWRACNAENLMPLGNHAAPWDEPKRPPMCVRRKAFLLSRHKERVGGVGNPGYCVVGFPEGRDDPSFSQTCDIKERPREGGQDPSSLQLSLD